MSGANTSGNGPDFTQGIVTADLADGAMLLGRVGDAPALLVRRGADLLVIGATCTHYGGPLAEGLIVGDTVRCPWHHACFSLRTGAALRPPALSGLPCWRVEQRDGMAFVREELQPPAAPSLSAAGRPASIVIVGGGAAGNAAAETLRQEGYAGAITLLSADASPPCDRPNLSKDYLAGTRRGRLDPAATARILPTARYRPAAGTPGHGDRTERARGASGGWQPNALWRAAACHRRRADQARCSGSLAAARARAAHARRQQCADRACAARPGDAWWSARASSVWRWRPPCARGDWRCTSLRPRRVPMERVMGAAIGDMVRAIHESHGVNFHLGATVSRDRAGLRDAFERRAASLPIWSSWASACVRAVTLASRRG